MSLVSQDFEMYQGEDKIISFHIVDALGADKVLTGATITWILYLSNQSKIVKSTTDGSLVINASNAQVILNSTDTTNLLGSFNHEMRLIDSNSLSEVVEIGKIVILSSFTK